jgi:hypothetical protein
MDRLESGCLIGAGGITSMRFIGRTALLAWLGVAATCLPSPSVGAARAADADIFVREASLGPGDADARLLIDADFGRAGAQARLRARLQAGGAAPDIAKAGWLELCEADYHDGRYRQGLTDCARAVELGGARNGQDTLVLLRSLGEAPPIRAHGRGGLVAFDGNGRVPVMLGDTPVEAVADTGAQISVMMQSLAEKTGVRFAEGDARIGSTTTSVSGRVGVIPSLAIGGAEVTDIPVLVLPDAQLTYEDGRFSLPLIVSLYALRSFGRIAWLDHCKLLALGEEAPKLAGGGVPVFWHPLGIGLPLDGPGGRRGAHFDTGSDSSFMFASGLPLLSQTERAAAKEGERRLGGVGGIQLRKVRRLPTATLRLAGQPLVFKDMVVEADMEGGGAARLGDDVLHRFQTVVLDFDRMRFLIDP